MQITGQQYYSHGKLLLSGEYLVMKGAKALALPLNVGQLLNISFFESEQIYWETFELDKLVFTAEFGNETLKITETTNIGKATYIQKLIQAAIALNPSFLHQLRNIRITCTVEFDMNWGFGSSSTLINNIANWAKVNPFALNSAISVGSGYDIACAFANSPMVYQLKNNSPVVSYVELNWPFTQYLSLVYLNNKMATENNIKDFLQNKMQYTTAINEVSEITNQMVNCSHLDLFMESLEKHEKIMSEILNIQPIKQKLFSDFNGSIKSLGAWGGDFLLVASFLSFKHQQAYFNQKGYKTVLSFKSLAHF